MVYDNVYHIIPPTCTNYNDRNYDDNHYHTPLFTVHSVKYYHQCMDQYLVVWSRIALHNSYSRIYSTIGHQYIWVNYSNDDQLTLIIIYCIRIIAEITNQCNIRSAGKLLRSAVTINSEVVLYIISVAHN